MTTRHSPFKYGDVGCGVVWNFHAQLLMKLQSSNHQPKEALAYGPADRCPEYIPEVGAVKRYLHTVDFSLEVHDPVERHVRIPTKLLSNSLCYQRIRVSGERPTHRRVQIIEIVQDHCDE